MMVLGRGRSALPKHKQQSMILAPLDTSGVKIERLLTVYGYVRSEAPIAAMAGRILAGEPRAARWHQLGQVPRKMLEQAAK